MKKLKAILLALVILIQLAFPVSLIMNKYDTLKTGTPYKFKVELYDPYDAYRGRYLALYSPTVKFSQSNDNSSRYGIIEKDTKGFAYISELTDEKPQSGDYLTSANISYFQMPIERYYLDEDLAVGAEELMRETKKSCYVVLKVKDGKSVIEGLYIGDTRIEDYTGSNAQK